MSNRKLDHPYIRVWACCGAFGYTIPWPYWHLDGIYPQPPDDKTTPYFYLYSIYGQLGNTSMENGVRPLAVIPDHVIEAINVDAFLMHDRRINWNKVRSTLILKNTLHLQGKLTSGKRK